MSGTVTTDERRTGTASYVSGSARRQAGFVRVARAATPERAPAVDVRTAVSTYSRRCQRDVRGTPAWRACHGTSRARACAAPLPRLPSAPCSVDGLADGSAERRAADSAPRLEEKRSWASRCPQARPPQWASPGAGGGGVTGITFLTTGHPPSPATRRLTVHLQPSWRPFPPCGGAGTSVVTHVRWAALRRDRSGGRARGATQDWRGEEERRAGPSGVAEMRTFRHDSPRFSL